MIAWIRTQAWPVLADTYRRWSEDDCSLLAAAMAYYAAFSLFPLCLLLISGLGFAMRYLPKADSAREELLQAISQNASPWVAAQLGQMLANVETNAPLNAPLAVAGLVIAAIGIFVQLDYMLDRIWGTDAPQARGVVAALRRALVDRLTAFLLLLALGGLLIALLLVDVVLSGLRRYVEQLPAGMHAWEGLQLAISVALNALLFGTLYRVLPRRKVRWRKAMAGGLLVAIIWRLGLLLLTPFLIGEKYSAYGVVGSFIAIMIWMYYASAAVFLGAEFVQALSRHSAQSTAVEHSA
jgi:membrane protein